MTSPDVWDALWYCGACEWHMCEGSKCFVIPEVRCLFAKWTLHCCDTLLLVVVSWGSIGAWFLFSASVGLRGLVDWDWDSRDF